MVAKDQYRSEILFHSEEQQIAAAKSKDELASRTGMSIRTSITPATEFYRAEERHQKYSEKHRL